jgi:hypothetical protein
MSETKPKDCADIERRRDRDALIERCVGLMDIAASVKPSSRPAYTSAAIGYVIGRLGIPPSISPIDRSREFTRRIIEAEPRELADIYAALTGAIELEGMDR